jgi:hypothetical protein
MDTKTLETLSAFGGTDTATAIQIHKRRNEIASQLGLPRTKININLKQAATDLMHMELLLTKVQRADTVVTAQVSTVVEKSTLAENVSMLALLEAATSATPAATFGAVVTNAKQLTPQAESGVLKTILAGFLAMDAATRLQFCRDGGYLAKVDFDKLTPSAKSAFCINGGKILADTSDAPVDGHLVRPTAAASFGK